MTNTNEKYHFPIYFVEGYAYINDIPIIICPLNTILVLYNYIESNKLFYNYNISKESSLELVKLFIQSNKNKHDLVPNFLKFINSLGFGIISLVKYNISLKNYLFKVSNPIFTKQYKALFNQIFEFYPPFILESLSILISYIHNKNISFKFINKNNEDYLEIQIMNENNFIPKILNETNYNYKKTIQQNKISKNPLITKVILNEQIKYNKGEIKIWNMNVVFIPKCFFNNHNIKFQKYFQKIGHAQGKTAYDIMTNIFGIREEEIIFNNIVQQSDLVGFGKVNIVKFNLNSQCVDLEMPLSLTKNKKLNLIGSYVIGILEETTKNIFNKEIKLDIKISDKIYINIQATNEKYKIETETKKILKFLNINKIIS